MHACMHMYRLTAPNEDTSHQQRHTVALADDMPKDSAVMETEAWQIDPSGACAGFPLHCCLERILCGEIWRVLHR